MADPFGWRLGARVGEGASSVVFQAASGRGGAPDVALKVAKPGVDWLGREALILASLDRRWGPSLVDVGVLPADASQDPAFVGRAYLATTWSEGVPLAAVAAACEGAASRMELARVVAHGVARGLEELHGAGVRHGDVKPANVLVHTDASGRLRRPERDAASSRGATLIDLGLATRLADDARGGTARYLPPEVHAGEPVGPAADVYALGLVLAEILAPGVLDGASRGDGERDGERDAAARAVLEHAAEAPWLGALLARAGGARPAAAWVADRAARALGLRTAPDELAARRRAHVRRAYVALAAPSVLAGGASAAPLEGTVRAWLEPSLALARRAPALFGSHEAGEAREAYGGLAGVGPLGPLGPLGVARWLVALVGFAAASWPVPHVPEHVLADRLLALAARAEPAAWTLEDVADRASPAFDGAAVAAREEPIDLVELASALARARPDARVLARAEALIETQAAPASLALACASALVRGGDVGRAAACLAATRDDGPELMLLRADVARRRGDPVRADEGAARALAAVPPGSALAGAARALRARLSWDRGDLVAAEAALAPARGAAAAEVRGLVAYARGDHDRGLRELEAACAGEVEAHVLARLEGTRGMLEHARGRAKESVLAFTRAAELATRAGAVVEEATYLTGVAAGAVDAGDVAIGLAAATRAALLWERLGRPAQAARAHLARASAFALVGAAHEADAAADEARARGLAGRDHRAAAFARWAVAETRARGDARARAEVLAAYVELAAGDVSAEDRARASARVLVWAEDAVAVDASARASLDASVHSYSPAARFEWWGARAVATPPERRVLEELLALVAVEAPLSSRGPALHAGLRLAEALSEGDAARRFELARDAAADVVRRAVPDAYRAGLAQVRWVTTSSSSPLTANPSGLGASQVAQLEALVRALSSRDRLAPLLAQVVDTMVLWTGVERGLLLLRAPDDRLVPRAARNLGRRDLGVEQLALSTSLARRAMEERVPVVATDAYAQVGDVQASVHALRLRSVLAVPLVARGDVLGVVYLDDRVRRGAFGPAEIAWVRLVASQAALAIADARDQVLLRRAVRRAERVSARLAAELGTRDVELSVARAELAQQASGTRFRYDLIMGRSEPMRAMLKVVDRVTASDVPVLVVGESGTGKELVARAIHENGARARAPFVSENCGSVPESLLEATLFGHVRGAFTGASSTRAGLFDVADGGTLFLDEIGEMPLVMQTKLLRVLQDGDVRPVGSERAHRVDVRIVSATHRDLGAMVEAGTFRQDLFYRLDVVTVRVPPLRERAADVPQLVSHFLEKYAAGRKVKVTRAALDRLAAFPWPGNVRQLENELRRALVLAEDRIDVSELSEEVGRGGTAATRDAGLGLRGRVDALEAQLVRDALLRTHGNQTRAAEVLGLSRFGLQKMMRRLGIQPSHAPRDT